MLLLLLSLLDPVPVQPVQPPTTFGSGGFVWPFVQAPPVKRPTERTKRTRRTRDADLLFLRHL